MLVIGCEVQEASGGVPSTEAMPLIMINAAIAILPRRRWSGLGHGSKSQRGATRETKPWRTMTSLARPARPSPFFPVSGSVSAEADEFAYCRGRLVLARVAPG